MANPPLNPYAPPTDQAEPATPPGGWSVQGQYLLVRDGTVLPEIDLDGRGAAGPLTPMALGFLTGAGRMSVLRIVVMMLAIGLLVTQSRRIAGDYGVLLVLVGVVVVSLLLRRVTGQSRMVTAKAKVAVPVLRAWRRRTRVRSVMIWTGLALFLSVSFVLPLLGGAFGRNRMMPWNAVVVGFLVPAGLLLVLGAILWQAFDRRWLCRKVQDGWVFLSGVGPVALAALAARQAEPQPPPRLRRVFLVRLHRLPLSSLARPYPWNAWAWLYLGLLKITRAKALEAKSFHWSERDWLPPEAGDPELRAAWDREAAGTPLASWTAIHAERQDGPAGNLRLNVLVFLSPDRQHVAVTTLTRVANARVFVEIRETGFRSWTADGRTLATGSAPLDGGAPAGFEHRKVRGPLWKIASRHLERAAGAGAGLVTLDPGEIRAREQVEYESRRSCGEAEGLYGPVEEIEMAG